MRLKVILALVLCLWTALAFGQGGGGSVLPQGVITPGNCTKFGTSKFFVADAGAPCGAGAGTVTSVGLALPTSLFDVTGTPVITAGTLTGTFKVQAVNTFFAGPASGASAVPTFRTISASDLPSGFSGFAIPTVAVGISPANTGVLTTALRSDAKLFLDQTAPYSFTQLSATVINPLTANITTLTISAATQTANTLANPTVSITRTNAVGSGNNAPALIFGNIINTSGALANKIFDFQAGGLTQLNLTVGGSLIGANDWTTAGSMQIGSAQRYTISTDLILSRAAAATLQLGAANAAAPIAQTLQAQGSRVGTDTNTGGANLTIASGIGTGTGLVSQLIFQVPVAVVSGNSTQTITPAIVISSSSITLPMAWFTSGTATTNKPQFLIEPTGTTSNAWSTGGTGLGINASSGFVGNLIDTQVNGSVKFGVSNTGVISIGTVSVTLFKQSASNFIEASTGFSISAGGSNGVSLQSGAITAGPSATIGFTTSNGIATQTTIIGSPAAATIRLGAADAAAPIPQALRVQSTVAGTSNISGADLSIGGSLSTGSTFGGDIIFTTTISGAGATSQNISAEVMRLKGGTNNIKFRTSIAGAGTQTFTNSPCGQSLTTARWIPVEITGQVGLYYIPACH